MNETLSRKENGAVDVGNMDLILPVRVRTCAEGIDRTEGVCFGSSGMQPVRASNGRNGEASQCYFAGRRVGRSACELPPRGRSIGSSPGLGLRRSRIRLSTSGYFGAWRCHVEKTAIHSDRMKSHAVSVRNLGRASAVYKAKPKGPVMRRIREAVSGSADLWDGSRAVVASLRFRAVKRETVLSEHARFGVDMGKLAAAAEATKWPARSSFGQPGAPTKKRPAIPVRRRARLCRDWRLSCLRSLKPTPLRDESPTG
jgi:hypothetical protein